MQTKRSQPSGSTSKQLAELEKRIARLERLAFLAFQDIRDVADYAYRTYQSDVDPEAIRPATWRRTDLKVLSDQEFVAAGAMSHELATIKMTMRELRRQTRRDVLSIVLGFMRPRRREEEQLDEAA